MQSGIHFFPLDTNLDTKLQLIECEYGLEGFAVIIKLWQKIYGGEGYFINWEKDIALLFARELGLTIEALENIIAAAVKREIFNKEILEKFGILTSSGIQKRFLEATRRRKETVIKKELLLIREEQIPQNVNILGNNVDIYQKNVDKTNQRKKEGNKQIDDAAGAAELYEKLFGTMTDQVKKELRSIENQLEFSVIKYIIELAKIDGKGWNWTRTVLKNAIKDGVKDVMQFEAIREQHAIKKRTEKKISGKNNFLSYSSNASYDIAEFEKRVLEKRIKERNCTN
ncbi:MAG: DUF4373 domain-containing protein [Clostridia bacterium]|nr:DUF4373 domain-containing protein [Clostridia bacterium]